MHFSAVSPLCRTVLPQKAQSKFRSAHVRNQQRLVALPACQLTRKSGEFMKTSQTLLSIALLVALYSNAASAELAFHDAATNMGVLDQVIKEFANRASAWQVVIYDAASWLFWTLGTISFAWTMGMLAIRKADLADFFGEFIRFTLTFGFFYWLLKNGPYFAETIISSMRLIGERASGTDGVSPSGIVDIGFMIWKQAIGNLSIMNVSGSILGAALSAGIMLVLALIAVNMLLLLIYVWILMYAGMFLLGFGGARWTSDIAINYYRMVLGLAVQLLVMTLLVGIGTDLLTSFYNKMSKGTLNFEELGVMLVVCIALLVLTEQVPKMMAGIISSGQGSAGVSSFGAGAAVGAAMGAAGTAGAVASMAGSAFTAGAQNISSGTSALMAAVRNAQASAGGNSAIGSFSAPDFSTSGAASESVFEAADFGGQSTANAAQGTASTAQSKPSSAAGADSKSAQEASGSSSKDRQPVGNTTTRLAAADIHERSWDDAIAPESPPTSSRESEIAAFVNGTHRTDTQSL